MTDPTSKEERERLRAGAEMAAAHGFDVTVSGNSLLALLDAVAERDALRERVAVLEAELDHHADETRGAYEAGYEKEWGDSARNPRPTHCNDPSCGMCGRGSGRP